MLVEEAESRLPDGGRVLDLGCGVGTIALWIARWRADADVVGVDVSEDAILCAKYNGHHNEVDNVRFHVSDVYENVMGTYDVITCTLPWEQPEAYEEQPEPRQAYISEDMGLARALEGAKRHLRPDGRFVMWGPYAIAEKVFPMVGLVPERYVFDPGFNCVSVGRA